ncbi:hypothetical protein BOX15_Mlig004176g1 [Macrostomum lignano]|uniref:Phosphotransferase n=2 Tax=Macrostomum lignano TaxID=282301 RepID=A0A267GK54_9PLAT|nr:hypothetical protein BOX15_Mlig004176g1 [Macrostomum lignano]
MSAYDVSSINKSVYSIEQDAKRARNSVAESNKSEPAEDPVECFLKEFAMSPSEMENLVASLKKNIDDLVKQRGADGVPIHWSYVPILPVGRVAGKCLSLDFGCNDNFFQVAVCNIRQSETSRDTTEFRPVDRRAFVLTPALRRAPMSVYCDFTAICVRQVLQENGLQAQADPIYMGIVAGFDARLKPQISPAEARVGKTFKDYKMENFINCDFVASFQKSMDKHGLKVKIVTVLNDAVCTLLYGVHSVYSRRISTSDCSISVVTTRSGANVSFLETDQDFLDSCTTDRRLLLRSPRNGSFCVVVNPEAGMRCGEKGELSNFLNNIEKNVLEEAKPGDSMRWECLSSGCWYPKLLRNSIKTMRKLEVVGAGFPDLLSSANCFEVFYVCDRYATVKEPSKDQLAKDLQAFLDPLERYRIQPKEAEKLAQVCQAIVKRSATMLASCIMAVAQRVYGKLLPERMVVAYCGAMFQIGQLLPSLQETLDEFASPINSIYPFKVELMPADTAFGCAVSAITIGKTLAMNEHRG